MNVKYYIIALTIYILAMCEAQADTYIVLPNGSPNQNLSFGEGDFDTSIDGLDKPVILAEEIVGNIVVPIEFALMADSALEWEAPSDTDSDVRKRILRIRLNGGSFDENITTNNFLGIGNCNAIATRIISGGRVGSANVEIEFKYTGLCGSDSVESAPTIPSAKNALMNAIAVSFMVKLDKTALFDIHYTLSSIDGIYLNTIASGAFSTNGVNNNGKRVSGSLISYSPAFIYELPNQDNDRIITATSKYNAIDDPNIGISPKQLGPLKADFKTPLTYADIESAIFSVNFESIDGFANLESLRIFDTIPPVIFSNQLSYTLRGVDIEKFFDNGTVTLNLASDDDPNTYIQTQTIKLRLEINYKSENLRYSPPTVIDTFELKREALQFGSYNWVGDNSNWALSVFRITGLSSNPPPVIRAYVNNASNFTDVTQAVINYAARENYGEVVINSNHLTNALGNFGTGDITFEIEAIVDSSEEGIVIRRLLQTPTGALSVMPSDYTINGKNIE